MTPQQCRMARAALGLGVRDLAEIADVSPNTVARLERGERLHSQTLRHLRGALEAGGVTFLAEGEGSGWGGPGVRLGNGRVHSVMAALFLRLWEIPNKLHLEPEAYQNAAAYRSLVDVLRQFLDIISNEGREPDTWERSALNEALNALNRNWLFLAFACIRNAITPPDNRSPHYPIAADTEVEVAKLDLDYFRECVSALDARRFKAAY
jgi:transcriptional regulator with XRE-family HTH domain